MIRFCCTCLSFAIFALVFFAQVAISQESETDWRDHVISVEARSFDFKTVPKGATPEHRFVLRNPFQEAIHIGSVTSSCVCTTIDFDEEKSILQTYDEAVIPVRLRGDLFDGSRNSTITVSLDKPSRTEIQLNVRGMIRGDLNISPNFIDFGNVALGKGHSRSLTITYTGSNTQWRLVDARCDHESIRAEITNEPARVGVKVFKVAVSLDPAAPNGAINCQLVLISNDALDRREIPIPVRAMVGTVIRVSPPALSLGVLPPGALSPTRDAVLLGTSPFRITKIENDNPALVIASKNPSEVQSRIHSLSVAYQNPMEGDGAPKNGTMRTLVQVTTDIPGLTAAFYVTARIQENEE